MYPLTLPLVSFTSVLTYTVKRSGIGVRNPVDAIPHNYDILKAVCAFLVNKIIDGDYLNTYHHSTVIGNARTEYKTAWVDQERKIARDFRTDTPALVKQYPYASNSGHWLLTIPNWLNGSQLVDEEFLGNLRIREDLKPL